MSKDRDERTMATADQWAARGWMVLSFALMADMLVRMLILKQHPGQWLDIAVIWMASTLYAALGMTASGVEPYEGRWRKMWPIIPGIVAVNTVVLALLGRVHTWADITSTITFGLIGGAVGTVVLFIILRGIHGRWERKTLGRTPREE